MIIVFKFSSKQLDLHHCCSNEDIHTQNELSSQKWKLIYVHGNTYVQCKTWFWKSFFTLWKFAVFLKSEKKITLKYFPSEQFILVSSFRIWISLLEATVYAYVRSSDELCKQQKAFTRFRSRSKSISEKGTRCVCEWNVLRLLEYIYIIYDVDVKSVSNWKCL